MSGRRYHIGTIHEFLKSPASLDWKVDTEKEIDEVQDYSAVLRDSEGVSVGFGMSLMYQDVKMNWMDEKGKGAKFIPSYWLTGVPLQHWNSSCSDPIAAIVI
ncbi:hypothetical protein HAX54_041347 [Datura stramonium]|uniref:Uncharacterized protein n=1 Tax=Datura stramonium TaxID=4076 RepID=A0ABS8SKW7_DATST|nr:hypothetical protein [Datura stramonium]